MSFLPHFDPCHVLTAFALVELCIDIWTGKYCGRAALLLSLRGKFYEVLRNCSTHVHEVCRNEEESTGSTYFAPSPFLYVFACVL
jgi:hypothetical protein